MKQDQDLSEPERRCIATGKTQAKSDLLRFVVSPDGDVVFDQNNKLPGRGLWVGCRREYLELVCKKGLFSRAARQKVKVPEDLVDRVDGLIEAKCLNLLGLSRRNGSIVTGFAKVEISLKKGKVSTLLAAWDGAEDGRKKLKRLTGNAPVIDIFNITQLSHALGQENVVHAALPRRGLTEQFLVEVSRLTRFRGLDEDSERTGSE